MPEAGEISAPSAHPLRRLWRYAAGHRRRVILAASWTTVNKIADVGPEILIGAAVDAIVRGEASFVAGVLGVEDRFIQLVILAALNVVVSGVESLSEYQADLGWRNLAQSVEHSARLDAYRHIQDLDLAWFEDSSSGDLLAILNDDVNHWSASSTQGRRPSSQLFGTWCWSVSSSLSRPGSWRCRHFCPSHS